MTLGSFMEQGGQHHNGDVGLRLRRVRKGCST